MKKYQTLWFLLISLIFVVVSFSTITKSWAAEEGGQVQTTAGIVLKKSNLTTDQTSDSAHSTPSTQEKKPRGRLPNTGDLIKISLLFTGVSLSLLVMFLFFWKRRKTHEGGV